MEFPRVARVRVKMPSAPLTDVAGEVRKQIHRLLDGAVAGSHVAVAVGSRGINNLLTIVAAAVEELKGRGLHPFIVPAMGSHGGATAAGQAEVLASYGITEAALGVPVRSSMEVRLLGHTPEGLPVYCDANAAGADAVLLINRVKPHTDFHGEHESGLVKMLAIGLGKRDGAELLHSYGAGGLRDMMPRVAREMLRHLPVLGGLAIVEDAYDRTARVEGLKPAEFETVEKELLAQARELMPALPFSRLDVLVVQEMGKNLSGTGMDTNMIGRIRIGGQEDPPAPAISRIVALDLTPDSHGNGLGVGLADVITRRLYDRIDLATTYANVITTGFLERGFIPITVPTDREAVTVALKTCGRRVKSEEARLAVIKNTLDIGEILVSAGLGEEVAQSPNLEFLGPWEPLLFDGSGALQTRL